MKSSHKIPTRTLTPGLFSVLLHLAAGLALSFWALRSSAPSEPRPLEVAVVGKGNSIATRAVPPAAKPRSEAPELKNLEVTGRASPAEGRQQADLKPDYATELRAAIEALKEYPPTAKALRQTGRVEVGFALHQNGEITGVRIVKSSGHPRLDESAVQTVIKLGRFKPVPETISKEGWSLVVPMDFVLD